MTKNLRTLRPAFFICSLLFLFSKNLNAQSAQRISFPGTTITLVPPADFVAEPNIPAIIQVNSASSITLQKLDSIPYVYAVKGFEENRESQPAIHILGKEDLSLDNGRPGVMILYEFDIQGVKFRRMAYFTGPHNFTIYVNATYPAEMEPILGSEMKKTLRSIQY